MEYYLFITWIFMVIALGYHFYVRSTIKTWGKERLLRKEETSLKEGVERYEKAMKSLRLSPYTGVLMVIVMVVTVKFAFPSEDAWIDFAILLAPLPVVAFSFYRNVVLMLARTQEFYTEEQKPSQRS
jgi:hypothetical protein